MGSEGDIIAFLVVAIIGILLYIYRKQVKQYIVDPYIKQMNKNYKGKEQAIQVDAWGAFVPGRGNLRDLLEKEVINAVKGRQLPRMEIEIGKLGLSSNALEQLFKTYETREYIFFTQSYGATGKATCALRVAKRGAQDLELNWRLMESNIGKYLVEGTSQAMLIFFGFMCILMGFITLAFGIGVCFFGLGFAILGSGFGWWGSSKGKSKLTVEQQQDSRMLVQTVDYCLMKALEKQGVSQDELRITQAAQTQGIGKLV